MTNEPLTESQIDEAMILVSDCDDIDPAFPLDALVIIADFHDLNLVEVLDTLLKGGRYRFGPEAMIQDIIDASQSNPDRAMLSMRWMAILEEHRANL